MREPALSRSRSTLLIALVQEQNDERSGTEGAIRRKLLPTYWRSSGTLSRRFVLLHDDARPSRSHRGCALLEAPTGSGKTFDGRSDC